MNTIKSCCKKNFFLLATVSLPYMAAAQQPVNWQAKWIKIGYAEDSLVRPAQYFKKDFEVVNKIKSAKILITSHGLYEAQLNGKRIGNDYFTPGWTSYNKRLQYQEYDVTPQLKRGKNQLNVTLGDGWYRGPFGFSNTRNLYGKELALLCQLQITYTNGKTQTIATDDSWQSAEGPIRYSEIYKGELIDVNKTSNNWTKAIITQQDYKTLIPNDGTTAKKHETIKPVKIFTTPKGEKVIDFGQNLVGWIELKANGPAGTKISIKHAEVLDKDGNFYTDNLRAAEAKQTYILGGKGTETLEPHFTYFGFRYIAIDGYPGELLPDNFTAVAIYADMEPTGSFECSNPLINQLQHNIQWGQKGNFLEVPTDCPQRDERLGWTGDAQVFFRTAAYNFNVEKFFTKWMHDLSADQRADGAVPWVVPNVVGNLMASTGWGDVATIIPWQMYQVYGNTDILKSQYPSMKAWVEFMRSKSKNNLWNTGSHFGDWLSYRSPDDDGSDAITDKYEIAQCFYAHSTQLLINAAKVLGKTADAEAYQKLLADIKTAYNQEYVTPSGRLMSNTQTAYVLALQFDMLPEQNRPVAAKYLVNNIKMYRNHLTTGFLGTPYLCHVLSRFGYTDVAYQLLLQESFPSWLYPVKKGATTIWERWDGIKTNGSFQAATMNSFNHYAYGAIGDWMYRTIAGIDTDEESVGYKKLIIKPQPGGALTYCKASLKTKYGKISVDWKITNGKFTMDVAVPQGTMATVYVPNTVGKNPVIKEVKAGNYHFE